MFVAKAGSSELVVDSSEIFTVRDGENIAVESGGYIDVEQGGYITQYASGNVTNSSGSTTLSTLTNSGLSYINTSGDTRMLYLDFPQPGVRKTIYFSAGTTGTVIYIDSRMGSNANGIVIETTRRYVIWDGTTGGAAAGTLEMIGHSTTRWIVLSKTTDMFFADTSS